jgi:hypothetical protein
VNNWDVMAPWAQVGFKRGPAVTKFQVELGKVPGVRAKGAGWLVPGNAVKVVAEMCDRYGVELAFAKWVKAQAPAVPWSRIEPALRQKGEVREWVLDGFLTPYQMEAVSFGWAKPGIHYWHPTGCLTGDSELIVNRAGKSFHVTLAALCHKFNGGESGRWGSGCAWDPDIPTKTASAVDGFLHLNTITAVFETGEKEVFEIKVGKKLLRATADHRFLTPDGFKRLEDLTPGDSVCVRGKKARAQKARKPSYRMRGVKNHPHATTVRMARSDRWCARRRFKPGYVEKPYRVPEHRLTAEAQLNGMELADFLRAVRAGGDSGLRFLDPAEWAVHHKNEDPKDNRPENLEVMTHQAHQRHHRAEAPQRGLYSVDVGVIESITPVGVEKTYDMTMESPHNNYAANGFVVHNSGKTLTGLVAGLSVSGPLIVVTRAASRLQFGREIERFTHLRPHVIRPEGERRGLMTVNGQTWIDFFAEQMPRLGKATLVAEAWAAAKATHGVLVTKGNSLTEYMKECFRLRRRAVLVVGWEALPFHLRALKSVEAGAVVFDELHQGKNSKRWNVVPIADPEGEDDKEKLAYLQRQMREAKKEGGFIKETDEGRKMFLPVLNRASAAAELARCVLKRIGTTATPIKDRVRDLWSQLDVVEPNAWGAKTKWEDRHCDRKPGTYGGFDTKGSSRLPELKLRLEPIAHILNYEETHRHLPAKRRQSIYLAPEDQCRPTGGFAKERREAKGRGPSHILECGLAEAASRKRPAIVGLVEDHVSSKHKVTLFTGRRRDCEALGKSIRASKIIKKDEVTVWVAHGDDSQAVRDEILQEYMAHPGPCVLVGTGPAFGESLNIHDTDAAFFVMLPYTPGQLRQWEGRFSRLGQVRPVIIYYVIAEGTVDEHMAAILIDKLPAVVTVVEDSELGEAKGVLAGFDPDETEEEFAASVLSFIDVG